MGLCWHQGSLGLDGLGHELKSPSGMGQFGGTRMGFAEPASAVPVKVKIAAIANEATTPLLTRLEFRLIESPFRSGIPRLRTTRSCGKAGSSVARRSKEFHSTFVEGERG